MRAWSCELRPRRLAIRGQHDAVGLAVERDGGNRNGREPRAGVPVSADPLGLAPPCSTSIITLVMVLTRHSSLGQRDERFTLFDDIRRKLCPVTGADAPHRVDRFGRDE